MNAVNDVLFGLESDLDRNEGDPLSRRLILRKALQKARDEGWDQGHRDGLRDYSETQAMADRDDRMDRAAILARLTAYDSHRSVIVRALEFCSTALRHEEGSEGFGEALAEIGKQREESSDER